MQESDLWLIFAAVILIMLAIEFGASRKLRHIPFRTALLMTTLWVAIALAFGVLLFSVTGDAELTLEYYTAYIIEETMSMDSLMVFIIVFAAFSIPDEDQHGALFYGVVGAIVFRAIFIFAGVELLGIFDWLLYVFGIVLVYTAIKTLLGKEEEGGQNRIVAFVKKHFCYVDASEAGGRLFIDRNEKRTMTAILMCIIVIEISDLIFAMDSIPTVLAISTNTLVIYTSNIFAVMGLRSLFFVIKGGLLRLRYLRYGLGLILLFVSVKLMLHDVVHIPVMISLVAILTLLAATVIASVAADKKELAADRSYSRMSGKQSVGEPGYRPSSNPYSALWHSRVHPLPLLNRGRGYV